MRPLLLLPALLALAACPPPGPRTIEIVAVNYAFQVPDSVPEGPALFTFVNHGTVPHEVQLYRFRRGVTADSGLRLLVAPDTPDSLFDASGAVLIASAGMQASGGVTADLQAGEVWALVCQFADSAGAPEHIALGMMKVMTVTGAP